MDEYLSDLIGLIYEASLEPRLWTEVMHQLTIAAPSKAAMISSHEVAAQTATFHQFYGLTQRYLQEYEEKWARSNPILDAVTLIEPGQVSGLAPLIDFDAFRLHPFHIEMGVPYNYWDAVHIMLERTPTRLSLVSLITSKEQGLADVGTIRRLEILAPHLQRSIRIGRVLEYASVKLDSIAQTLDALASAVFLLDEKGDLVHANRGASDLAARGLTLARIKTAFKLFTRAIGTGVQATPDDRAFVVEIDGGERLVCHALPLEPGRRSRIPASQLTLVIVKNVTSTDSAARTAATLFGLTNREREVLLGLVEIGGVTPVATVLGISVDTVKSHVKALFLKTQTNRQSDLVKLVTELTPPFHKPA